MAYRGRADLAGQPGLETIEITLPRLEQDADQVDDVITAGEQTIDFFWNGRVPGLDDDLADRTQRLQEVGALGATGGHAHHRAQLGKSLDHVAADEPRTAEHRHDLGVHRRAPHIGWASRGT